MCGYVPIQSARIGAEHLHIERRLHVQLINVNTRRLGNVHTATGIGRLVHRAKTKIAHQNIRRKL